MNLRPDLLRDEARDEAYQYFDENIRKVPRKPNGTFDEPDPIYVNSDADAFRHAYVSAIFTCEYGTKVADLFGRLNELTSIFSPGASPGEKNMDLWNNSIGRKYGEKFRDKTKLKEALQRTWKRFISIVFRDVVTFCNDMKNLGASNPTLNHAFQDMALLTALRSLLRSNFRL